MPRFAHPFGAGAGEDRRVRRRSVVSVLVLLAIAPAQAAAQSGTVVPLSDEEKRILEAGDITSGERASGIALGLLVGFGSGQAVQGRYPGRGVFFTLADTAVVATGIVSLSKCWEADHDSGQMGYDPVWCNAALGSIVAFGALRIWQTLDAIVVPASHNRRLREIRAKVNGNLRYQPTPPGWKSYVAPATDGRGALAGALLTF